MTREGSGATHNQPSTTPQTEANGTISRKRSLDWSRIDDMNFEIFYSGKGKKRKRGQWSQAQVETSPWHPDLDVSYQIKPDRYWAEMPRYRKFTITNKTFEVGCIVLVANVDPVKSDQDGEEAQAGAEEGDEQEHWRGPDHILNQRWVGQVLEVRALSGEHVFVRVLWFYKPEELPHGKASYHGRNELLASNAIDIIDVRAVADSIDVRQLKELDDEPDLGHDQLFWRQRFDCHSGTLSELRKRCVCQMPANPDELLIQCDHASCGKWLHSTCIAKDAVKRAYEANSLLFDEDVYEDDPADQPMVTNSSGAKSTNGTSVSVTTSKSKKRKSSASKANGATPQQPNKKQRRSSKGASNKGELTVPAKQAFAAKVVEREATKSSEPKYIVQVIDLREGHEGESWEQDVTCLCCDKKLD